MDMAITNEAVAGIGDGDAAGTGGTTADGIARGNGAGTVGGVAAVAVAVSG